jgi:hypothetical protein
MNDPNYAANVSAAWQALQSMLAPAVLAESNDNALYIRNYVKKFNLDLTQVSDLYAAVQALDEKSLIEWSKSPVAPATPKKSAEQIQREFDEKERQRIEKEAKENAKPFDVAARTKAAEEAEAHTKRQDAAKTTLGHLLNTWSVNSNIPGRIDQNRTSEGIKILSGIRILRGKQVDYELTLKCVQRLFHSDGPSEIANRKDEVIQQVINEAKGIVDRNAAKAERERRMAEERRHGAGTANLPRYN